MVGCWLSSFLVFFQIIGQMICRSFVLINQADPLSPVSLFDSRARQQSSAIVETPLPLEGIYQEDLPVFSKKKNKTNSKYEDDEIRMFSSTKHFIFWILD